MPRRNANATNSRRNQPKPNRGKKPGLGRTARLALLARRLGVPFSKKS